MYMRKLTFSKAFFIVLVTGPGTDYMANKNVDKMCWVCSVGYVPIGYTTGSLGGDESLVKY